MDEAYLPVKIYHGHVASIKDQCDFWLSHGLCRFITMNIFAQICGLPEMIMHSIPNIPPVTLEPLYMHSNKSLYKWCLSVGSMITENKENKRCLWHAITAQNSFRGIIQ